MSKKGMIFGGHTVSHRVLSKLSKKEILNEVKLSLEFVDNYSSYRTFAYLMEDFIHLTSIQKMC